MNGSKGRVLFAVPAAFPVGGLATWLDTLLPDLAERGWESWLAITDGRHADADRYLELHPFERHVRLRSSTGSRFGRWLSVDRALEAVLPSVVVVANLVDLFAAIGRRRLRGEPSPRVVTAIHSLDPGLFADLDAPGLAIDRLAAPNRLVACAARGLTSFPAERISYASYGVDLPERFAPDPEEAGSQRALRLVYAGRFERDQKRIDLLPPLLAALDRRSLIWSLEIAGAGPEGDLLRSELERFGDRVVWRGALPPKQSHEELLRPGSVLVLTSRWELGPVVGLEAMARGLVVVAPRFVGSGLEGALRDGETALLYAFGDVEGAAARIAELASDALRHEIATAARAEAARRYSRPVAAAAWDELLTRAVATAERPVASVPVPAPSGRMESWLGLALAEAVRTRFGLEVAHTDSGSEWPHTLGGGLARDDFFARLEAIDQAFAGTGD